eukprot:972634-Lingulodinium_polyedra.AAC.1
MVCFSALPSSSCRCSAAVRFPEPQSAAAVLRVSGLFARSRAPVYQRATYHVSLRGRQVQRPFSPPRRRSAGHSAPTAPWRGGVDQGR